MRLSGVGCDRGGGRGLCGGRPGRGAVAGADLQGLLTARRGGRICATIRSSPASRATAGSRRTAWPTRAMRCHPGGVRGRRGGASAVRRADRLPVAEAGRREAARALGVYGFGGAAHPPAQVAVWQGRRVHAFTRPGDAAAQAFALSLGCASAQDAEAPPEPLDAAIIFAPVGALVPEALRRVRKGGRVVCGGIHMGDIPAFPPICGASGRSCRWRFDAGRRRGVPGAGGAGAGADGDADVRARAGQRGAGPFAPRRIEGAAVLIPPRNGEGDRAA